MKMHNTGWMSITRSLKKRQNCIQKKWGDNHGEGKRERERINRKLGWNEIEKERLCKRRSKRKEQEIEGVGDRRGKRKKE